MVANVRFDIAFSLNLPLRLQVASKPVSGSHNHPLEHGSHTAETTIVSRHLQFEFEVATLMIAYDWLCYIYIYELRVIEAMIRYLRKWGFIWGYLK